MQWAVVAGWWTIFAVTFAFRDKLKRREQALGERPWLKLVVVAAVAVATVASMWVAV